MDISMEENSTKPKSLGRLTLLDALRGFSLLGVILMHMLQQFAIFSFAPQLKHSLFPTIDPIIDWVGQNIIMGRFINIFAFLFGLSFFIQMDRSAQKGVDFSKRFIWRMLVMLGIGILGMAFYSGEIITLYAAFGILLVLFNRAKSWILLGLASLLLLGAPRAIQLAYEANNTVEVTRPISTTTVVNTPPDKSTFTKAAYYNYTQGLSGKLKYQFGLFGRGYITFSLFLLGLLAGRARLFEHKYSNKRILALFSISVVTTVILTYATDLFPGVNYRSLIREEDVSVYQGFVVMGLRDLSAVAFSTSIVLGFMLLYQQLKGKGLDTFAPYGRMSLTNYEMQSVIGCMIFSMWAWGAYFESWGSTQLFLLGIGIYIFQILFSKFWMRYFLFGPLEWFLRTATYLKIQPFERSKENESFDKKRSNK